MSQITYLEETESTTKALRGLMTRGRVEEGAVVMAGFQTAGRGQVGNVWESEAGKNLLFGLLFHPREVEANRPRVQWSMEEVAPLGVRKGR